MKRTFSKVVYSVVIASLLFSMPFTSGASATTDTFTATAGVNVRAGASTDSNSVSTVNEGASVTVLEHNPAGWSRVQVGNTTGFIRSDFLRFPESATFRTTAGVNIRSGASTDSDVVGSVNLGASVTVSEHNPAGWSRVQVGSTTGFIRSDFLTRSGAGGVNSSTNTSTAATTSTMRTIGNVNFRTDSSMDSSVIRTLARGTSVAVVENLSNGWSRVQHNGTDGFIDTSLLTDNLSQSTASQTLRTTALLRMRSGPSTNDSVIRQLPRGTRVNVLETTDGWSRITHNETEGFVSAEFLTAGEVPSATTLRTNGEGVRLRAAPNTESAILQRLAARTSVEVISQNANGWSNVRVNGQEGFIRSDLLSTEGSGGNAGGGSSVGAVEFVDWSTARNLVPLHTDLRVVDVRTGITFNLRAFSLGGHADVEPPTRADTDAILRSRNGVWAWAPRPVWVTMGGRTFAAALNGLPHDVSTISDNGMNGHLCLHFGGTVTRSKTYQRDLRAAVQEAFDARPR